MIYWFIAQHSSATSASHHKHVLPNGKPTKAFLNRTPNFTMVCLFAESHINCFFIGLFQKLNIVFVQFVQLWETNMKSSSA